MSSNIHKTAAKIRKKNDSTKLSDHFFNICILLHLAHDLLKILLSTLQRVVHATVPRADGQLYAVLRVVKRLEQQKHFLGLLDAKAVVHRVTLATFLQ